MDGKKKFYLKWPYNVIVYVLLVVLLRIFAIPVILLIMWWNKKQQPDGPEGGYCLDRTRKRLARLLWSVLYLLLAAGCGVVFFMGFGEEKAELSDWAVWIVSGGGFAVFVVCFVIETWCDLRDALFPAKSRLAKSIRSQLPYPDEAPPVEELFAMVDQDIEANGQWFDRLAIGKEWVFGDDVSAISRIRGVFPRDEIKVHYTNGRRQSARVIELYIVDDRRQIQATGLRKPAELQAAVSCLRLRAPEAFFDDYKNMSDFTGQSEEEWQAVERSFARRRDQRRAQEEERERLRDRSGAVYTPPAQEPAQRRSLRRLSLSDRTGATRDYDSFTRRDVELAGEGLAEGKYTVAALFAGSRYLYLKAGSKLDGRITVNASRPDPDMLRVFETKCTDRQAREWLIQMYEGTFNPDFSQWKDVTRKLEKEIKK